VSLPTPTRRMLALFKPYSGWLFWGIAFGILFGLTEPLLLQLLKPILDHGSEGQGGEPLSYLVPAAIIGLSLLRGFLLFASTYLLDRVSETLKRDLQASTLRHTLQLPLSYFGEEDSAILLRKIAVHVTALKDFFLTVASPFVQGVAKVIGYAVLLVYTQWQLALIFLVVMPALVLIMARYAKRWRILYRRLDEEEGGFGQYLIEIFRSVRVVKAFGAEEAESRRYSQRLGRLYGIGMRARIAVSVARIGIQVTVAFMFAAAILAGIYFYNEGEMTIGDLGVFTGALLLMPVAIRRITDIPPRYAQVARSAEVVFDLLDQRAEHDAPDAIPLDRPKGGIELRGVSFTYPRASSKALDGIDLAVAPAEKVALVGRSGSGKSTLISLLLRLHDPDEGTVLVDGADARQVRLGDLRGMFSWVTQEPHLFSGSIADNVAYPSAPVDPDRLAESARLAGLEEFAASLPEGLDSKIGEGGAKLSGGQRQRLSIARAFYRDAPVLLLDEISSALDSVTEAGIYANLRRFSRDRTVIVISHRLSPIREIERIVILDEGRIEAQGTHAELLETSESYRRMCATQDLGSAGAGRDGG